MIAASLLRARLVPQAPAPVVGVLLFALHLISWHIGALFFHFLDTTRRAERWKVSRCRDDDLDYFGMIGTVLANQAVVILPSLLLCDILQLLPRISTAPIGPAITLRIITSLFGFGIVHDGLMYVSHRCILHSKWGYRWHVKHHRTRASVAASSLYMSPTDCMLEIVLPFLGWFLLLEVEHIVTVIVVVVIGGWMAMYEHSGYNFFPGMAALDTSVHATHHRCSHVAFSEGLGSPGVLDWVFSTSATQNSSIASAATTVGQGGALVRIVPGPGSLKREQRAGAMRDGGVAGHRGGLLPQWWSCFGGRK